MAKMTNLLPPFLAKASAHFLFRPPTAITYSNLWKSTKKTRNRVKDKIAPPYSKLL